MAKTKKSKTNVQRHKIIKRMQNELEEHFSRSYAYPECVKLEIIKEILIIIFFRIVNLNILAYDTIGLIYYQIMKLNPKYRVYQLLKIYLHLQLQKLFYDGIISEHQLESIYPKNEKILFRFEDEAYNVDFGYEFCNKVYNEELLDEETIWALCAVADNLEIDGAAIYGWYDEITSMNKETLIDEIKNLIARLKIRELRNNGIMTEYDEEILMSKIQECNSTYNFFTYEEIARWRSKAIHSLKELIERRK